MIRADDLQIYNEPTLISTEV